MTVDRLQAAFGLTLHRETTASWRLAWDDRDWLGPIGLVVRGVVASGARATVSAGHDAVGAYTDLALAWSETWPVRTSVRAYTDAPLMVFRIEASAAITELATGRFEQPSVAWPLCTPARRQPGGAPNGVRTYGHQYTEFALPVNGDADCLGFFFAPHRPPVVEPLLFIAADHRTVLLAPLDHFHDQIIAVPADPAHVDDGVRCGWHGDLDEIPAGFATELAIVAGPSPRAALAEWASLLRRRHGTQRLSRYADALLGTLSYWTDNGATYYYRTEPEVEYITTLERVVHDLRGHEIPVGSVQIDSWFYPHQQLRPVSAAGAPMVPPSGMLLWEPRADLFPEGWHDLKRRLGNLPLTLHSRHFSRQSPYWERYTAWTDGDYAHPCGPDLYERFMAQAAGWGAITYEQDWMVESFLGVRGLRAGPGRARRWQEDLDHAAGEYGLHLQWCMSTPADFLQTVTLRNLASIRTSGDYRYLFDNGLNWVWFLHTNALARVLGLHPYKDVFLSHGASTLSAGEPYAEVEALLAGLSTGPVGIGDQIGCSNRELIMRICREDGVLIKPDVPLAAVDRCFRANSFLEPSPLIAECYSDHPAGRWMYVASFNASRAKAPLSFRIDLGDLGAVQPDAPVLAYDWRRRVWQRLERAAGWDVRLEFQEWDYRILCPLLPGNVTVFGDVSKYATAGDRRIAGITSVDGALQFDVLGAPHTSVEVRGYAADTPRAATAWTPAARRMLAPDASGLGTDRWSWDDATHEWVIHVDTGSLGFARVALQYG